MTLCHKDLVAYPESQDQVMVEPEVGYRLESMLLASTDLCFFSCQISSRASVAIKALSIYQHPRKCCLLNDACFSLDK